MTAPELGQYYEFQAIDRRQPGRFDPSFTFERDYELDGRMRVRMWRSRARQLSDTSSENGPIILF